MVAPVIVAIVSSIAMHPTQVACDADVNHSGLPAPPGFEVGAWTIVGGSTIHVLPRYCRYSFAKPPDWTFAKALEVFIHEAAHARGVHTEACAEMTADVGVYDIVRRFYGIPFFTPLSKLIGAQVLIYSRELLPDYQPERCWNSGTYG